MWRKHSKSDATDEAPASQEAAGALDDENHSPAGLGDTVIEEESITITDLGPPSFGEQAEAERAWRQELMRAQLALLFTLLLFVTVGFACWASTTKHWPNARQLLQVLLPAETALLGSATGFYFGTRR